LVFGTEGAELWVIGEPVGEVVFRKDGEVAGFRSCISDEGYCFGVVGFYG
jgi:hypothetical protein